MELDRVRVDAGLIADLKIDVGDTLGLCLPGVLDHDLEDALRHSSFVHR